MATRTRTSARNILDDALDILAERGWTRTPTTIGHGPLDLFGALLATNANGTAEWLLAYDLVLEVTGYRTISLWAMNHETEYSRAFAVLCRARAQAAERGL